MSKYYYPGANSTIQNFSFAYPGDTMETNCMVIHSTEGFNWPGYSGGANAPNMTIFFSLKEQKMYVRQHFAANKSARALVNQSGGVQTNTNGAFQIELIGTCNSANRSTWYGKTAGIDYIYWPEAPSWTLRELAKIVKWLNSEYPAFKMKNGAPRGWLEYPSSYGNKNGQRMTFAEWNALNGIVGHQHVPENHHGDPGNFKIATLIKYATAVPTTTTLNRMDPSNYFIGAKGEHVTWLGYRLIAHGFARHFTGTKYVPGPVFSEIDRLNVRDFQRAQGWTGGSADGFPGTTTLKILAS